MKTKMDLPRMADVIESHADADGINYIMFKDGPECTSGFGYCLFDMDALEYVAVIRGPEAVIRKRFSDLLAKVKA